MNRRITLLVILVLLPCLTWAFDFGLVTDQTMEYGGLGSDNTFSYSGSLIPWFSALFGEMSDFYISAGFEAAYREKGIFVPELLRTEFSYYTGILDIKAGRMYYTDPLGFIAEGLFDGASVSMDSDMGTFSAGAWYTGLQYKRRANIIMSAGEMELYDTEVDYDDFSDTYFAPKRLLMALGWEHLSLGTVLPLQARFSLLTQFGLSGDEKLHSQYAVAKATLPINIFSFDLGGCLELIEKKSKMNPALAAELGASIMPPLVFPNKLSLLFRYSSGGLGSDGLAAFLPLTIKTQGEIFKAALSGITMMSLDYIIRLHNTFSAGVTSSYFFRSDKETYMGYPAAGEDSDGNVLGNEFFFRLLWSPFTDLNVNLGGGVFLPSMGNVEKKAGNLWRMELKVIFSL